MLIPVFCGLVSAVPLSLEEEHVSPFGFRIVAPEGWVVNVAEDTREGRTDVKVQPEGDIAVQVQVKVEVLDSEATSEQLLRMLAQYVDGRDGYSDAEEKARTIGDHTAHGMRVDVQGVDGVAYRVEQYYLVREGLQYTLEQHAPRDRYESLEAAMLQVWDTFELREVALNPAELRQRRLARRCGSQVDWVADWDTAAARAEAEGKLLLVHVRRLGSFVIADDTMGEVYTDPDVVALIRERFVAHRLTDITGPLARRENYGLSGSTFGTSLLIAQPDGRVVADLTLLEAVHVDRQLIEALERIEPEPSTSKDAAALLRQGRVSDAEMVLANPATARDHLLRARCMRRQWRGEEALTELAKARQILRDAPVSNEEDGEPLPGMDEVTREQALTLLRMGRFEEAEVVFDQLVQSNRQHEPEARYWKGALLLARKKNAGAVQTYQQLMADHEESPWAWKAAGRLQSSAFALGFGERLDWPDDAVFDSVRQPAPAPVAPARVRAAEREAIEFLLTSQLADGSWASPTEASRTRPDVPDAFTEAITALCIQGLLVHRTDERVHAALQRGVEFLFAAQDRLRAFGDHRYYMDYSVWRNPLVLWCLADCLEAKLVNEEDFAGIARELLDAITSRQRRSGGWSYYVTSDLQGGDAGDQSISFITAAIVVALNEAAARGASIPDDVLESASAALARMRNPNGTHEYFLYESVEPARATAEPGAAGRAPVCHLAEWYHGQVDLAALRGALELFVRHREALGRERGKSLMHCGDHGQGSHYLMFDYAFAARTLRVLPAEDQEPFRRAILEEVLKTRRADGSFLDNPMTGRNYATGMALQAFRDLFPEPRD